MPGEIVNSVRYHVPVSGFTQAVKVTTPGAMIFVSGLTARQADGAIVAEGDIRGQTRQIFENLEVIPAEAGGTLQDVVRTVQYFRSMPDHPGMQRVQDVYFDNNMPTSTSIVIAMLCDPSQLIEIEAIAALTGR